MRLGRLSGSALFPPTIEGFLAADGGLTISSNSLKTWWPGTELNRRRQPFQGCALPPELPGHVSRAAARGSLGLSASARLGGRYDRSPADCAWNALDYSNRFRFPQRYGAESEPETCADDTAVSECSPKNRQRFFMQNSSRIQPDFAGRCLMGLSRSTASGLPSTPCRRCRDESMVCLPRILSETWPQ